VPFYRSRGISGGGDDKQNMAGESKAGTGNKSAAGGPVAMQGHEPLNRSSIGKERLERGTKSGSHKGPGKRDRLKCVAEKPAPPGASYVIKRRKKNERRAGPGRAAEG